MVGKDTYKHEEFPPVISALVRELERLFPNKRPDLKETDREVWFKAGQASVVEFLRGQYAAQQETKPNVHGRT